MYLLRNIYKCIYDFFEILSFRVKPDSKKLNDIKNPDDYVFVDFNNKMYR